MHKKLQECEDQKENYPDARKGPCPDTKGGCHASTRSRRTTTAKGGCQASTLVRCQHKALKKKILRIFGPRLETGTERALKRTLTGKPGQLVRESIDDICPHTMQCPPDAKCIAGVILAIWKSTIPTSVQAAIAGKEFNQTNLDSILQLADKVFDTCRPAGASVVARVEPDGVMGQVSSPKPAEVPEGMTLAEHIAALRKDTFAAIDKLNLQDRRSGKGGQRNNSGGRGGRSGQGGRGGSKNDRLSPLIGTPFYYD